MSASRVTLPAYLVLVRGVASMAMSVGFGWALVTDDWDVPTAVGVIWGVGGAFVLATSLYELWRHYERRRARDA